MRKLLVLIIAIAGMGMNAQTSYTICGGNSATIVPTSTLSNPQYTLNPGNNAPNPNGEFVVTPTATTVFTVVTAGTNSASTFTTYSYPVTVVVNPQPFSVPTVTNFACNTTTNAFNLNLTFQPANPAPSFTINWLPPPPAPPVIPTGWLPGQTSLTGTIAPGIYTANIVANGGCQTTVTFTLANAPAQASFSFTPLGPTFSITCANPTVNISVSNPAHTYTWNGNVAPFNGTTAALTMTNIGNWSVTATHTVSGCQLTRTFALVSNTVPPTSNLTPTFQSLNCANPNVQTVSLTAVSPTVNFTHFVYASSGNTFVANTQTAVYQPGIGTYTYCLFNNANGCSTCKEFTVQTAAGQPTFNVVSPQNFTLGCSSKSTAVLSIVNASTTPVPGGALSYTFLAPGSSSALPTGPLGSISSSLVSTPGEWTVVTRDNANLCDLRIPVSVVQNTFGPSIDSVYIPNKVLTCAVPLTTLQGVSEVPGATYNWSFPGGSGIVNQSGSTLIVNANFTVAPTTTLIANYTLTVTDPNNACITRTVIPMVQNLFPPTPSVTTGGTFSLTCSTPTIVLTNQSKSNVPPLVFPTGSLVVGLLWEGPSPQISQTLTSTYLAETVGFYTMTVRDNNNGCTSFTTVYVGDNRNYPVLNLPTRPKNAVIQCGNSQAKVFPLISSNKNNLVYTWTTAIVPTPSTNLGPGKNIDTLRTNAVGLYSVTVTNSVSGCSVSDTLRVVPGQLNGDISADRITGYAPLTVTFLNNSYYTTTNGAANSSITTVWSFGNGSTGRTNAASEQTTTVYSQPGTYTTVAYVFAGASGLCVDTVKTIIQVEVPSRLNIPNIFSPNGDGVNDILFLGSDNLSTITAEIYDRWGHKVYELTTEKGNIAWDGKNQYGKEVPDGTYLYIIRATGRDSKEYDTKGTITLVR